MRILVTSTIDLRKTTHSRVHQFVDHLAEEHDVVALCLNSWWMARDDGSLLYDDDYYGQYFSNLKEKVQVVHFSGPGLSPILQDVSFARRARGVLAKMGADKMDVHLNCSAHLAGFSVARSMRSWGIPTVLDILDDLPEAARVSPRVPRPLSYVGWRVALWVLRRNVEIASKVTVINAVLRDTYGWARDKCELVPNGVDTKLFTEKDGTRVRQRLGLMDDFVIGYVGLLREWIDLEPAFLALALVKAEVPNAKLLIVGEEGDLRQAKDLAVRHGVADRVVFAGTAPYVEVPDYIAAMDVCLNPRKPIALSQSAFPLKLLEYMACVKPVVSTPLAGVREAVGDRVLYASDSGELAVHIRHLSRDEALRYRLGREGRRFVARRYTWKAACSLLEDILVETAGRRSQTGEA
jgi:glycosyltransferase involved in cell wall biosynthesis